MWSAARSAKISMILCMPERVSGGDAEFQGFRDGWNKWDGHRPEEAIPWLEKAMIAKRYCCYLYAHVNMGRALLVKGRFAEARRAFERALAYDPAYPPALKGLDLIRRLGSESL